MGDNRTGNSGSREPRSIRKTKDKGDLIFGTVKDGTQDRFYAFPKDLYDEAVLPFSKDEVAIARIPRKHVLWLAQSLCGALTESEWEELLEFIEFNGTEGHLAV